MTTSNPKQKTPAAVIAVARQWGEVKRSQLPADLKALPQRFRNNLGRLANQYQIGSLEMLKTKGFDPTVHDICAQWGSLRNGAGAVLPVEVRSALESLYSAYKAGRLYDGQAPKWWPSAERREDWWLRRK